jgi:hypothetical protein
MSALNGQSGDPNVPAVTGVNTATGFGLVGNSTRGTGVHGVNDAPAGASIDPDRGCGVWGESTNGYGVFGSSDNFVALQGVSKVSMGVHGMNDAPNGSTLKPDRGAGIWGESNNGYGLFGASDHHEGIKGVSKTAAGVHGVNDAPAGSSIDPDRGCGILGESANGYGVFGSSDNHFAIKAVSKNGVGLSAEGPRLAAFFRGDVEVTGDIRLTNADCAEDFDMANVEIIEPGTVMILGAEGGLLPSHEAYDKRVAGVISGAGNFKPGIVLDKQHAELNRKPIALLGKVYCKVDASFASIEVGDLLTTAPTQGHAMKAADPLKAFGAVIGKALRPLKTGQGLIPILIALQ